MHATLLLLAMTVTEIVPGGGTVDVGDHAGLSYFNSPQRTIQLPLGQSLPVDITGTLDTDAGSGADKPVEFVDTQLISAVDYIKKQLSAASSASAE